MDSFRRLVGPHLASPLEVCGNITIGYPPFNDFVTRYSSCCDQMSKKIDVGGRTFFVIGFVGDYSGYLFGDHFRGSLFRTLRMCKVI